MSNYKVKVNNEAESREVQELFFELGYGFEGCKNKTVQTFEYINTFYFFAYGDLDLTVSGDNSVFSLKTNHKELTILQLKDLVVLKRNSIDDATHKSQSGFRWFVTSDNKIHSYSNKQWVFISDDPSDLQDLKPIIKPLKEYLVPQDNGKYALTKATEKRVSDWVEVPEGADIFTICETFMAFWKDGAVKFIGADKDWDFKYDLTVSDYLDVWGEKASIVWKRHTQPEELPFMDDEAKSLNDTYAEIEQVRQKSVESTLAERQSTYGDFTSVANTTGQLMAVILNSKNGQTLSYAHEEALHMICSKIARIVNGNMNHKDSWHDISGYAKLIEDTIN